MPSEPGRYILSWRWDCEQSPQVITYLQSVLFALYLILCARSADSPAPEKGIPQAFGQIWNNCADIIVADAALEANYTSAIAQLAPHARSTSGRRASRHAAAS